MNENQDDIIVQFSVRLAEALEVRVEDHNEACPSNKASLSQAVKVYKHAATNFPQEALGEIGINKWSLARVNMYLRMKCGSIDSGGASYKSKTKEKMSSLIFEESASKRINTFLDATQEWLPSEEDFSLAQEGVIKYDLNYDFNSLDEIYFPEERSRAEGLGFNYE